MAKSKVTFVCQECGYESSGWLGKCPACSGWNTFVEEIFTGKAIKQKSGGSLPSPLGLLEVSAKGEERLKTGMKELDRVLGGGIVQGSLILIGGDPGIGKSTLILQICDRIEEGNNVLYVSGEESESQVNLRAKRLGVQNRNLFVLAETDFLTIQGLIESRDYSMVIIDSIQTMNNQDIPSASGSVSQVRDITARLMKIAKSKNMTILVVGHVTKEGSIAGPRVLEHMVDTVLYFEGERHLSYRILRAVKNRFGSTNEIGIFEMREEGLTEVANPSEMMLSGRPYNVPGSVVVSTLEGTRPMLIEVQGLVCETSFGMPRRMATGVDYNRITMLIAVLEKKVGYMLHHYDAYVNVVGGLKIDDTSCDLGFVVALASSFKNSTVDPSMVFIGEMGLTGEIRGVGNIEKRILEASRIGFKKCMIPEANRKVLKGLKGIENMEVIPVDSVGTALEKIF
jgi:DNA repair protein RadA/Sms